MLPVGARGCAPLRFSGVYGILSATNTAARVRQGEDGNVSMGVYRRGSNCAESCGGDSGERAFRSRGIFAHARAGGGVRAKVRRARMRELGRTLAQRGGRRLYRNAARVALSVSDGVHRGGHARTLRKGFYRQRGAGGARPRFCAAEGRFRHGRDVDALSARYPRGAKLHCRGRDRADTIGTGGIFHGFFLLARRASAAAVPRGGRGRSAFRSRMLLCFLLPDAARRAPLGRLPHENRGRHRYRRGDNARV